MDSVFKGVRFMFYSWNKQEFDDTSEGTKVCTYYKVDSVPVVLVIDLITRQKMRSWSGMIHPDRLLEIQRFFVVCFGSQTVGFERKDVAFALSAAYLERSSLILGIVLSFRSIA
ncbi:hypothetical protein Nepgr_025786 [Nepenthes gracilis]|uniref:Uncharacterized protein n=1 Tax=Nepenthes gracilis TaxID=150966 RepID=A0AAD3T5K5_NEPGR|nr:hypothetical protein Nepgr_025786 [Nepenthes gracilis]